MELRVLKLSFLGTGGGRFMMITQRRRTAGIRLQYEETNLHLDPGPGALVFSNWAGLNPQKLGGVLISHGHLDHYGDAEVLIEAMTEGTTKKHGYLLAPKSVISGNDVGERSVSLYHQQLIQEVVEMSPGKQFRIEDITVKATRSVHGDPDTIGFRFTAPGVGEVGYTSDTSVYPGIGKEYEGLRLLVLCTIRPRGSPLPLHLSIDDAFEILHSSKPLSAVLTGFGMGLQAAKAAEEAKWLEEECKIPVVAAEDGMTITIGDKVTVQGAGKRGTTRVLDV